MKRRKSFSTFEEAPKRGPYDEFPMLPPGVDPQLCLSRNDVAQPFYLVCEYDTVLLQMSGTGRLHLRESPVLWHRMAPGDFAYVPAGMPHRYVPDTESIQLRYKAEHPGLEGVTWYSEATGARAGTVTWDTSIELPQEGYLRACTAFNADAALRTCKTTGEVLPPLDLAPFRWKDVASELRADGQSGAIPAAGRTLAIAAPDGKKEPLKVNAFAFARVATTMLTPIFPYLSPGSIVPCTALHRGGPYRDMGHFVHYNSLDEVYINLGNKDFYAKVGIVRVGPNTHGVGERTHEEKDDAAMVSLSVITQRHPLGDKPTEAFIQTCMSCNHVLYRYDKNVDYSDPSVDPLRSFVSICESSRAAETFNNDERLRICPECGTVNERFPFWAWGWKEYRTRTAALEVARESLAAAAHAPQPAKTAAE
jgi:AraC-like ligand binding domain